MSNVQRRSEDLIVFQANGEAFTETIDLFSVERLLPEYRRLLDTSIRITTGLDVHRHRAQTIHYNAKFEPGCLDVVVDIAMKAVPMAATVLAVDGGSFHLAKTSFQLISKILEFRKKLKELLDQNKRLPGFQMNMQGASLEASLVAPIVVNGNNNTINVAPQIYFGALASHGPVNRLAKVVDGKMVSDVNLQNAGLVGETLTVADRDLAKASMGGGQQVVQIQGRLDSLAISTRSGHIVIGDSRFPVEWEESVKGKLKSALDRENAVFSAIPIADFTRLSNAPVRFRLVDCHPGQFEL